MDNAILLTAEDLKNALVKSEGFLASTRKNRGKITSTTVCVVDPAITDCQNIGSALHTGLYNSMSCFGNSSTNCVLEGL